MIVVGDSKQNMFADNMPPSFLLQKHTMLLSVSLLLLILLTPCSDAVIDGFQASRTDILSQVSVVTRFRNGHTIVCGAVLIAPSVVLTSAHCVFVENELAMTAKITSGVHLHKQSSEQEFWSHALVIPTKFEKGSKDANDDVAVVFLPEQATVCLSPISPQIAKLPSTSSISFIGSSKKSVSNFQLETSICYIAGWGRTENEEANYSDVARQMMVRLTVRRLGFKSYLLAKGVGSSRACTGDSGSPVYCFIDGKRTLVGTVAQIGSFGSRSPSKPSEHTSFCRDFEYTFVSDWRESSRRVVEMLEKYGESEQLAEGQRRCNH